MCLYFMYFAYAFSYVHCPSCCIPPGTIKFNVESGEVEKYNRGEKFLVARERNKNYMNSMGSHAPTRTHYPTVYQVPRFVQKMVSICYCILKLP